MYIALWANSAAQESSTKQSSTPDCGGRGVPWSPCCSRAARVAASCCCCCGVGCGCSCSSWWCCSCCCCFPGCVSGWLCLREEDASDKVQYGSWLGGGGDAEDLLYLGPDNVDQDLQEDGADESSREPVLPLQKGPGLLLGDWGGQEGCEE